MTRDDLIDILRQRYNEYGFAGIIDIVEYIRSHGQLHDPEWHKCVRCGNEWERELGQHSDAVTCPRCQARTLGQFQHVYHKPVGNKQEANRKKSRIDGGVATPPDVGYGDPRQPDLIG